MNRVALVDVWLGIPQQVACSGRVDLAKQTELAQIAQRQAEQVLRSLCDKEVSLGASSYCKFEDRGHDAKMRKNNSQGQPQGKRPGIRMI